ncbi:MAG: GNAT family N-acetyltransferase [Candidatus Eremiobacteraeota bacterium]|nr:GNAT family N-acetyltransferase [Candidatus Eremiobacteraeota bacterium]
MHEASIAPASESDIVTIARRRWSDETSLRLYRRLADASSNGAWAARDDGTPIALGFANAVDEELYVSELYVEPSFRRNGIGTALFERITEASEVSRAALVDAMDCAALAFATRHGIALQVPVVRIAGAIPREEDLARMAAGHYRFGAVPLDPRRFGAALDALDREVRGCARPGNHDAFAQAATGTAFTLDGECVGYSYVWPDGKIGPHLCASNAYGGAFFAYALASLVRSYGASWCTALVPGNNVRVLKAASKIGLSIDRAFAFASDTPMADPTRYIGFHQLAF